MELKNLKPEKLERCPFCGGIAESAAWINYSSLFNMEEYIEHTKCSDCGIGIISYDENNQGITIKKWNSRVDLFNAKEKEEVKEPPIPCPYCGDKAEIVEVDVHEYFIRCKSGCVEQCKLYKTKGQAIKAWNRRKD